MFVVVVNDQDENNFDDYENNEVQEIYETDLNIEHANSEIYYFIYIKDIINKVLNYNFFYLFLVFNVYKSYVHLNNVTFQMCGGTIQFAT